MKISLLLATKNRPEKLKKCLESIINTVNNIKNIEIVFGYNVDDDISVNTIMNFVSNSNIAFQAYKFREPYHLNDKYNYLGQMASNDIIMSCADDLTFITKDWDEIIINKFLALPKDKISCMWINDGPGSETLPRHYIIHRNWLSVTHNYACHLLSHYFSDNWIYDVAKSINRFEYLKEIEVEHSSPCLMNTVADNVIIDDMNKWFIIDQNVYLGTKPLRDFEAQQLLKYINNNK